MPANVQTIAYYVEEPWHGLGAGVPKGVAAAEMIRAAGLDWSVELRAARGAKQINSKGEYSRYEVVRMPREKTEEVEVLLGVVSRRYQPLQNVEAFEIFDPIVGEKKAYFETAGSLGEGERTWVMGRMPDAMQIVPGDECLKYLLLSNTHTGEGSVIAKFTSLIVAMEDGQKAYRVWNSKMMQFRLNELADFLAITQKVFLQAEECFRRLAKIKMVGDRLESYFEAVFPRSEAQQKKGEKPDRWSYLKDTFEGQPDLQLSGVRGTLWGAYNAVTCFEDYKQPQPEELQEQQGLERTWFGGGAEIKLKGLEKAQELSTSWN